MNKILRGIATGALATALLTTGVTSASAAISATATPSTGVKSGDTITVNVTGLSGTVGVYASLCKAGATAMTLPTECDPDQSHMAWINAVGGQGSYKDSGPVLALATFTSTAGVKVDCLVDACVIYIRGDHNNRTDMSLVRTIPLSFVAGAAVPVKKSDSAIALLNGVEIKPNVPGNLTYREPMELVVRAASGLPVTLKSLTPDCSVDGTKIMALTGKGTCAFAASTAGNDTYAAFTAAINFPFYLHPATQKITSTLAVKKVVIGKPVAIKKDAFASNMAEAVSLVSTTPNRCTVKAADWGWTVTGAKTGACKLVASAPELADKYSAATATSVLSVQKATKGQSKK